LFKFSGGGLLFFNFILGREFISLSYGQKVVIFATIITISLLDYIEGEDTFLGMLVSQIFALIGILTRGLSFAELKLVAITIIAFGFLLEDFLYFPFDFVAVFQEYVALEEEKDVKFDKHSNMELRSVSQEYVALEEEKDVKFDKHSNMKLRSVSQEYVALEEEKDVKFDKHSNMKLRSSRKIKDN
jgi:hypothetical protein